MINPFPSSRRSGLLGRLLVPACLLFAFGSAAVAETFDVHLDPAATKVSFLLGATGHDVHGLLVLSSGDLRIDRDTLEAEGDLVIDARLATTDHAKRDKAMHRKVLESVQFPSIRFRAEHLEEAVPEEGTVTLHLAGTMNLLGVDHPFTLPIEAEIHDGRFTAHAEFTVPYIEWGLHNPSILVLRVARTVEVTVETEGEIRTVDAVDAERATAGGR